MEPRRLLLSKAHVQAMRTAAETAYPEECCGLLVGLGEGEVSITDVKPAANLAEFRDRNFMVDPQAQFDLLRVTRGTQLRIAAHYHSHPNGEPNPSERDLVMAHDPAEVWVVIAVDRGRAGQPRAFIRPREAQEFREIDVQVAG